MNETLLESLSDDSKPVFEKAVSEAETDFLRKPDQDLPFFLEVRQKCKDGAEINVEMQARFQLAANGDLENGELWYCTSASLYNQIIYCVF